MALSRDRLCIWAFTTNNLTLHNIEELRPLKELVTLYDSKLNILHFDDIEGVSDQRKENKKFMDC